MRIDYAVQTPEQVMDELSYRNYSHNRRMFPLVKPEEYRCVFGGAVEAFEQRYQREIGELDELQQRLASAYATLLVSTRGDL